MRALCGAIITAAAVIGLGLTAIGFGTRYQTSLENLDKTGLPISMPLSRMDTPLIFILFFLTATALVGLGIAFLGLAYHHKRRCDELQWEKERYANQQRVPM